MLLVETQVLAQISSFKQLSPSAPEAGGILMGYRRGPHMHVTEATAPAPRDIQWRFGFFRHATHHQQVAVRRWQESGATLDYVGEWHTHPEDDPSPSGVDLAHWRIIAEKSSRPMLFLILGRSSSWLGVGLGPALEQIVD